MNVNDTIGIILMQGTTTTTGNLFLTLMLVMIFLFVVSIMLGGKLEYTAIIFIPLILVYATEFQEYIATLGALLFYLTIILTKNFFFK